MALWDKVRQELEHAGKIAQGALDEGKVRLEGFRARQRADQAAQVLGYAVYRARQQGQELDSDTYARLSSTLAGHEAEAVRYEARLAELSDSRRAGSRPADTPADTPAATPPPASADTATAGEPATQLRAPESAGSTGAPESGSPQSTPPSW